MNREPRIGVFFSKGRMFLDALKHVHAYASGARITAIVPESYPLSPEEHALAREVDRTPLARYSWRNPLALWRLIQQVRRAQYDAFVILFDSPRLNIVAALVGAPQRFFCRMDGQLVPIQSSIVETIADTIARSIRGRLVYIGIWLIVRVLRVR